MGRESGEWGRIRTGPYEKWWTLSKKARFVLGRRILAEKAMAEASAVRMMSAAYDPFRSCSKSARVTSCRESVEPDLHSVHKNDRKSKCHFDR